MSYPEKKAIPPAAVRESIPETVRDAAGVDLAWEEKANERHETAVSVKIFLADIPAKWLKFLGSQPASQEVGGVSAVVKRLVMTAWQNDRQRPIPD